MPEAKRRARNQETEVRKEERKRMRKKRCYRCAIGSASAGEQMFRMKLSERVKGRETRWEKIFGVHTRQGKGLVMYPQIGIEERAWPLDAAATGCMPTLI